MSFVSAFITKDFASIMSDGQVTGDNKESVQDDYKKIIKVNSFLIGFTGNGMDPVELVKAAVQETSNTMGEIFLNRELLLTLIRTCLNNYSEYPVAKINFVLVGFSEGTPSIDIIYLDNSEIYEKKVEVKENGYKLVTLCPFDYRLENGSEGIKFKEKVDILFEKKITLYEIVEIQREINDFVADNSDTVNKRVFSECVRND